MADDRTRHVMLFGLKVVDDALYRNYRAAMTPILHRHGGAFGYDFVVSEVLQSETPAPINRVFTMVFPERALAERLFADPAYLAVRAEWFDRAVRSVTKLAAFDEPATAS